MSYAGAQYSLAIFLSSQATSYLTGASVVAPVSSNLLTPAAVGKYGKTSFSNTGGGKTALKAIAVRLGKGSGLVSLSTLASPGGAMVGLPAYGN